MIPFPVPGRSPPEWTTTTNIKSMLLEGVVFILACLAGWEMHFEGARGLHKELITPTFSEVIATSQWSWLAWSIALHGARSWLISSLASWAAQQQPRRRSTRRYRAELTTWLSKAGNGMLISFACVIVVTKQDSVMGHYLAAAAYVGFTEASQRLLYDLVITVQMVKHLLRWRNLSWLSPTRSPSVEWDYMYIGRKTMSYLQ